MERKIDRRVLDRKHSFTPLLAATTAGWYGALKGVLFCAASSQRQLLHRYSQIYIHLSEMGELQMEQSFFPRNRGMEKETKK